MMTPEELARHGERFKEMEKHFNLLLMTMPEDERQKVLIARELYRQSIHAADDPLPAVLGMIMALNDELSAFKDSAARSQMEKDSQSTKR